MRESRMPRVLAAMALGRAYTPHELAALTALPIAAVQAALRQAATPKAGRDVLVRCVVKGKSGNPGIPSQWRRL